MLLILANLLCWIPAVFGYGIVFVLLRRKLGDKAATPAHTITEAIFGMLALSVVVNVLNFAIPIGHRVSLVLMIAGWVLFWFRVRSLGLSNRAWSLLILWVLFLSFWATQIPRNPDTGVYHIQAVEWLNQAVLPLGQANVNDRFGFNSSWFSVTAIAQLPFHTLQGVNSVSISALLIYFAGISVFQCWRNFVSKEPNLHSIFLALVPFLIFGSTIRRNISSPSPDLAVLLLCVTVAWEAIRAIETRRDWTFQICVLFILALFGVTIKQSSLPLFFIPVSLLLFAWTNRIALNWKKLVIYASVIAGVVLLPWLARAISLSGCFSYPIAATCISDLAWTVPRSIADYTWLSTKTSAHLTYPNELPMSLWIGPWFKATLLSPDFLFPCIIVVVAFLCFVSASRTKTFPARWLVIPFFAALVFWFFSAPDIRFGAGYLWCIALLFWSVALHQRNPVSGVRIIAGAVLICALAFLPVRHYSYFGFPPVFKAIRETSVFLMKLPIPEHRTQVLKTPDGTPIHVPRNEPKDCWLSELPCTPFFNENLRSLRNENGAFEMFYFPKEK